MIRLPDGLSARAATFDDVDAVASLVAACELAVHGEVDTNRSETDSFWRQPSLDIGTDILLVLEGDRVLAEGEVFHGRRAEVHVHPDACARSIGTALLGWTEDRARAVGSKLLGQTVPEANRAAVELLKAHGYTSMWTSWVLEIRLTERPPPPVLPDTIAIRELASGRDEYEAYETIEMSFEWPHHLSSTFEDWAATTTRREDFEPWQMQLAVDGDEVVGAVFFGVHPDGGWVDQLAVRRPYRGRGIARALLQRAFVDSFDRGTRRVRLATDSRTGALGLYERLGMHATRRYTHYAKEL